MFDFVVVRVYRWEIVLTVCNPMCHSFLQVEDCSSCLQPDVSLVLAGGRLSWTCASDVSLVLTGGKLF